MTRKFVKFPKMWQAVLAEKQCEGATYRVALHLLERAHWSEKVALGNGVLEKQGVSRWAKWRALKDLRKAGLIAVEHRRGKAPLVKVRFTQ
jgi:hypothetical protein